MAQTNAQRVEETDDALRAGGRPVASFKQGGVEVAVWRNQTEKGEMYNTTIRNSYKDDSSGEWKETTSFSPRIWRYCLSLPARLSARSSS